MRSGRFLWGVLFFVLFFAESGRAGGYALPGVGGHANGMGGAFRAIADDWSAVFWNPAGMAFQTRSEMTLGGTISSSRVRYVPRTASSGYSFGFVSDSTQERFPFDRNVPFGNASLFFRFPKLGRLNLGAAVFTPYHSFTQWNLYSLPYEYKGVTELGTPFPFPERNFKSNIRVVDVHPTVALSLMNGRLAMGAGLSIDRADWNFTRPVLLPVEESFQYFFDRQDSLQDFRVDSAEKVFENHPELKSRPEDNVGSTVRLGLGAWGVGGNLGILFKPTDKFSVGFSYHSPIRFNLKGEYEQEFFFPFNQSKLNYFPTGDPVLLPSRFIFSGQGREIFVGSNMVGASLKLPQDFGVGVAFKPSGDWTVAADFAWYNWKVMDRVRITFADSSLAERLGSPTFQFDWKNTVRFSGGVGYRYRDRWVFRLGYFFDQSPIPDSTFSPLFLDVGDKHSFNFATSYLVGGNWEFNYNLEVLAAQKRDFSAINGLFVNLPGTYKDTRFASAISVAYRFDVQSSK